jgi:hypothetical protein
VTSLLLYAFDPTSIVVSAYLTTSKEVSYTLDNWLETRQNYSAYYDFYTNFVRAIVGKRPFRKRLGSMAVGDEIATVSDEEALTLLGIENSYEIWNDIYKNSKGEIRSVHNDDTFPEDWKSSILPKYTRTSKSDPAIQGNTDDKCWSREGILRFNALGLLVIQDRADYPDFKIKWFNQVRTEMGSNLDPALTISRIPPRSRLTTIYFPRRLPHSLF